MTRYNSPLPSELQDVLKSAMRAEKECLEVFSSPPSRSASPALPASRSRPFGLLAGPTVTAALVDRNGRVEKIDDETEIRKIQPKVAIRDKSPHLFEIIPLREARERDDFNVCTASPQFLSSNSFGSSSSIKSSLVPLSPSQSRFASPRDFVLFSPHSHTEYDITTPGASTIQSESNSAPGVPLIHFDLVPHSHLHGKLSSSINNYDSHADHERTFVRHNSVGHEDHDNLSVWTSNPTPNIYSVNTRTDGSLPELLFNETLSSRRPCNNAPETVSRRRHSERRFELVSLAEARIRQATKRSESWPPIGTGTAPSLTAVDSNVKSVGTHRLPTKEPYTPLAPEDASNHSGDSASSLRHTVSRTPDTLSHMNSATLYDGRVLEDNAELSMTFVDHKVAIVHEPTRSPASARSLRSVFSIQAHHLSMSSDATCRTSSKRLLNAGSTRNCSLSDIDKLSVPMTSTARRDLDGASIKRDGHIKSRSTRRNGVVFSDSVGMSTDVRLWEGNPLPPPHILLPVIQPLCINHEEKDNMKLDLSMAQAQGDHKDIQQTFPGIGKTMYDGFSLHPGGHATAPLSTDQTRRALSLIDTNSTIFPAAPRSLDSSTKLARVSNRPLGLSCSAPVPFVLGAPAESTLVRQRNAAKLMTENEMDCKVAYHHIIQDIFHMLDDAIAEWTVTCSL